MSKRCIERLVSPEGAAQVMSLESAFLGSEDHKFEKEENLGVCSKLAAPGYVSCYYQHT